MQELKFNSWGWTTICSDSQKKYHIQKTYDAKNKFLGLLVRYINENDILELVGFALMPDQALNMIEAHRRLLQLNNEGNTTNIRTYMTGIVIDAKEGYLSIGYDSILHDKGVITFINDHEDHTLTNLIADIIVESNIDITEIEKNIANYEFAEEE